MPSRLVMDKFRKGKLRSGNQRTGNVVRDPKQARAIQISEARNEGHNIPRKPHKRGKKSRGRKSRKMYNSRSGRRG
jgi:Family of unknown function (DUF6496)